MQSYHLNFVHKENNENNLPINHSHYQHHESSSSQTHRSSQAASPIKTPLEARYYLHHQSSSFNDENALLVTTNATIHLHLQKLINHNKSFLKSHQLNPIYCHTKSFCVQRLSITNTPKLMIDLLLFW